MSEKESSLKKRRHLQILGVNVFVDGGFDVIYLTFVFLLLAIGMVMMFSASYVSAKYDAKVGYDSMHYIKKQMEFAIVGIALMFLFSRLNPELVKKLSPFVAIVALALLIAVLVKPMQIEGKEEFRRWLWIGFQFQPSEVAKLSLIMLTAMLMDKYKHQLETRWWVAPLILIPTIVFCVLIHREKHLSATIIVACIGLVIMLLGGADKRWFIYGGMVAVAAVALILVFRNQLLSDYQVERIDSMFSKDYGDTATRWQTNQSLYALGSGGFFGLGLGKSRQKYLFMPEPQNDFVFAIVGEELGFLRSLLIILAFVFLVYRGFAIAMKSKSRFERLLVLGISFKLALQVIFNLLVVTDVMPNTGISLPFFSAGGTALIMQLVEVGMVLAVSRSGERVRREVAHA